MHCGTPYRKGKIITVYNIEVYQQHNYKISKLGILVHNDCRDDAAKTIQRAWRLYKQRVFAKNNIDLQYRADIEKLAPLGSGGSRDVYLNGNKVYKIFRDQHDFSYMDNTEEAKKLNEIYNSPDFYNGRYVGLHVRSYLLKDGTAVLEAPVIRGEMISDFDNQHDRMLLETVREMLARIGYEQRDYKVQNWIKINSDLIPIDGKYINKFVVTDETGAWYNSN